MAYSGSRGLISAWGAEYGSGCTWRAAGSGGARGASNSGWRSAAPGMACSAGGISLWAQTRPLLRSPRLARQPSPTSSERSDKRRDRVRAPVGFFFCCLVFKWAVICLSGTNFTIFFPNSTGGARSSKSGSKCIAILVFYTALNDFTGLEAIFFGIEQVECHFVESPSMPWFFRYRLHS